jgi:hypothetical protein
MLLDQISLRLLFMIYSDVPDFELSRQSGPSGKRVLRLPPYVMGNPSKNLSSMGIWKIKQALTHCKKHFMILFDVAKTGDDAKDHPEKTYFKGV